MASNDDEKLKEQQIWNVNKTLSENLKMNWKGSGVNACNLEKNSYKSYKDVI